jgi:uncharacterized protein (DUF362 family)
MAREKVSIVRGRNPGEATREAIELVGGLGAVFSPDSTVVVKPNLTVPSPSGGPAVTDVAVTEQVVRMVLDAGATRIVVGDRPGIGPAVDSFTEAGYLQLKDIPQVELVDFDEVPWEMTPIPGSRYLREVALPQLVVRAEAFINVAKIKTHSAAIVTLCAKNLFGLPPTSVYGSPRRQLHGSWTRIQDVIHDLNLAVPSSLCVLDGIVAMEGNGPVEGSAVPLGVVVASRSQMAADVVACSLMGIDPRAIPHLVYLYDSGKGPIDLDEIEVVGTPLEEVRRRFELPPQLADNVGVYAHEAGGRQ